MTELERYKKALQLAGKVAVAAADVRRADVFHLSACMFALDRALQDYDRFTVDWVTERDNGTQHFRL